MADGATKALSDILSVLAMTFAEQGSRQSLKYSSRATPPGSARGATSTCGPLQARSARAGHAYHRDGDVVLGDDLLAMVRTIVPFHLQHSRHEAVDLLLEVERLPLLLGKPTDDKVARVCLRLRTADYAGDEEGTQCTTTMRSSAPRSTLIPAA